jgi:hypothetical protein
LLSGVRRWNEPPARTWPTTEGGEMDDICAACGAPWPAGQIRCECGGTTRQQFGRAHFKGEGNLQALPNLLSTASTVPYMDRSSLETVVGEYLALPYRSPAMDRLLVDVLIAMELYAYGDEMLNEKTFGLFPARSPLKQRHALLAYLRGQLINAVLLVGIAALALWANSKGWVSESSAWWVSGICVFLFLLSAVVSTFALPFAWRQQAKERHNVAKLLLTMAAVYNELRSDGPISAQYIRDRANNAAAQEGVVWPAPLFALLDDVISRTGRF